ncbi:MAG: hypothetical protein AB7H77_08175, partial [Bdellovibrionales bacterium]
YQADLPYADIKLRIGGARAVLVSVFGRRGLTMGMPPFLDDALEPWRAKLKDAGAGKAPFDKALEARAMRDALALEIAGLGKVQNFRRVYPLGLSPKAMQEILRDTRRALNRFTFRLRATAAAGAGCLGAAVLAAFILTPLHATATGTSVWSGLATDLGMLGAVMGLCWMGLGKIVQFKLKKEFPGVKVSLHGNAGNAGGWMLGGIVLAWVALMLTTPAKPLWLGLLSFLNI